MVKKFEVGDEVILIESAADIHAPFIVGNTYTITELEYDNVWFRAIAEDGSLYGAQTHRIKHSQKYLEEKEFNSKFDAFISDNASEDFIA